jgi:hypothetical protein
MAVWNVKSTKYTYLIEAEDTTKLLCKTARFVIHESSQEPVHQRARSAYVGKSGEQSAGMEASETEEAIVGRRLAIGAVLTVVTIAFALVPTEQLDGSASKPSYFYLVPVLRSIVRSSAFLLRLLFQLQCMPLLMLGAAGTDLIAF